MSQTLSRLPVRLRQDDMSRRLRKKEATIYTLMATGPEIARLKEEEIALEGVAQVMWSKA
jgi:hypothetical protein